MTMGGILNAMSEESTTPDLVTLTQELGNAKGVDATMPFYGADAMYDMSRVGLGTFEGRAAIRRFLGDWLSSYQETEDEMQETIDRGNGIVFARVRETGRPSGSPDQSRVHAVYGFVFVWTDGKVARVTVYTDVDEARAAAERLAESRD
jgi:ketosteroid isomerase-like protein